MIPGSGRSPGEGNGYPLQYSCLENPMDRGAWWAAVQTGLNDYITITSQALPFLPRPAGGTTRPRPLLSGLDLRLRDFLPTAAARYTVWRWPLCSARQPHESRDAPVVIPEGGTSQRTSRWELFHLLQMLLNQKGVELRSGEEAGRKKGSCVLMLEMPPSLWRDR